MRYIRLFTYVVVVAGILTSPAAADTAVCLVPAAPGNLAMPRLDFCRIVTQPQPAIFSGHTVDFDLAPLNNGPLLGNPTFDSFFDVTFRVSLDGLLPTSGTGVVHIVGQQVMPGLYASQMVQLNLQAGALLIRLNQGQISQGATQFQLAGNQFQISSFFDIFPELSTDGGNTWTPSLGLTQLVYKNAPTFPSILGDINDGLQFGLIDNQGIANSLSQKIHAAENATGQQRNHIMNAFGNEVKAQAGKHITGKLPFVLIVDRNYYDNTCACFLGQTP